MPEPSYRRNIDSETLGHLAAYGCDVMLERAKGIEPSYAAWEAAVLPLNYARGSRRPS